MIGAGNVGTHLSKVLSEAGFIIKQIYSRNLLNASRCADYTGSEATDKPDEILSDADLYLFALSDKVINEFSKNHVFKNKLLVHTSGSLPSSIFSR